MTLGKNSSKKSPTPTNHPVPLPGFGTPYQSDLSATNHAPTGPPHPLCPHRLLRVWHPSRRGCVIENRDVEEIGSSPVSLLLRRGGRAVVFSPEEHPSIGIAQDPPPAAACLWRKCPPVGRGEGGWTGALRMVGWK